MIHNGLLGDDADCARLSRARERLAEGHFRLGLLDGGSDCGADDIHHRAVELVIDVLLAKGSVHNHAVPVVLLILRECGANARRLVCGTDRLCVSGSSTEKDNDLAVVVLIYVSEAHALAVGSKGKVIIRHQEFAVRRAVRSAVQFDLLAESRGEVIHNRLLGHDADCARLLRRGKGLAQRNLFRGFFKDGSDCGADDIHHRAVELVVNVLLREGAIHDHAVPVVLLILREGGADTRRLMRGADVLRVTRRRTEQDDDLTVVVLVDIGEADALAVGSKGEVIIRHQQFAVRGAVRPAVELHLLTEGRGEVIHNGLLGHDADCARLSRGRERLAEGYFRLGLGSDRSLRSHTADQLDRVIEYGIIGRLGKGLVRDDAVPVLILILRESTALDIGVGGDQPLHVGLVELDQGEHVAIVRLIDVDEAHALAVGRKCEVIIRHQELAIRGAICPAVDLHSVTVLPGEVSDDGLLGDTRAVRRRRRRQTVGQRTGLCGNDHNLGGSRFELADALVQSSDLLVLLLELRAVLAVLRLGGLSLHLSEDRQADESVCAECDQHGKDHVNSYQCADSGCHNIHNAKLSHCSIPPRLRSLLRWTASADLLRHRRRSAFVLLSLSSSFSRRSRSR